MSNAPVSSAIVPAGTYVVGDPCYSIPNDLWMEWLEAADNRNIDRSHVLQATVNGMVAVGVRTYGGDGCFPGNDGNEYPVDAGLIGLVPIEVADKNSMGDARVVVTFDTAVTCFNDMDGNITLGHIVIATGDLWECEDCGIDCESGDYLCYECEAERDSYNACEDCGVDVSRDEDVCDSCEFARDNGEDYG